MTVAITQIGPQDHGRLMSLADFDQAECQPGYFYELSRGVVTVVDIPRPSHLAQVSAVRRQLGRYQETYPDRVYQIAGGGECKLLLVDLDSERHPDVAVYKSLPPSDEAEVWARWIPELVVEVVSPGSEQRDYVEKREEYLAVGIKEYWIVDAQRREVLVLRRHGGKWREKVLRPGDLYEPRSFPGLRFDCRPVFQAMRSE